MNKLILVGGGGHAKVILSILERMTQWDILGYVSETRTDLHSPYLGTDDCLAALIQGYPQCQAVIAVGCVTVNTHRETIWNRLESQGFQLPAIISPHAFVANDVSVGKGSIIMNGAIVQPGVTVGKGCILNTHCTVEHDCKIEDFSHIASGATLSGGVHIERHTVVGAGSVIIQGIQVGSQCVIGAGAVVVHDCKEKGTYVGVPARKIT